MCHHNLVPILQQPPQILPLSLQVQLGPQRVAGEARPGQDQDPDLAKVHVASQGLDALRVELFDGLVVAGGLGAALPGDVGLDLGPAGFKWQAERSL